jgi:hypothetical protein
MKRGILSRGSGLTGLGWRIGATAGMLSLCVLSTVRGASGAFEGASLPVADLTAQNGMVTGTMRLMGNRFLLYNGTKLESMAQGMEVNFERGGSMLLCPRSQLQILAASQSAGMMLAFQAGGAQQPFPLKMGDQVITPDWRVELTSDSRQGDMGLVQVVTNRHGDLCLQGSSQQGSYFRVTQLIGDESFRVAGGQSERFSDGKMETSAEGCGCNAEFATKSELAKINVAAATADPVPPVPPSHVPAAPQILVAAAGSAPQLPPAGTATAPSRNHDATTRPPRKHPQDVAGYVSSFVHKIFGR